MHIVGLITEYNPFHNGHLYHINQAKQLTGADYVIVVMSGNFVQRGAPAIIDKYSRTAMALHGGADLVIEIPSLFATSSAEDFASCSISLLHGLGVVEAICFGSESGNIEILQTVAESFLHESTEFSNRLKQKLKIGIPYPAARAEAFLETTDLEDHTNIKELLTSPNNILGIEYVKALLKCKSPIKPYTITRYKAGYHDTALYPSISSATAIRNLLKHEPDSKNLLSQVPNYVSSILEEKPLLVDYEDFATILSYRLLSLTEKELVEFLDISPDLSSRIYRYRLSFSSIENLIQQVKTKQYTYTRISRCLLHIILNIRTEDVALYKAHKYVNYARILGFKKKSQELLSVMKKQSSLPLVTKIADANYPLLEQEIFASHLYNAVVYHKYGISLKNEYTHGLVIL